MTLEEMEGPREFYHRYLTQLRQQLHSQIQRQFRSVVAILMQNHDAQHSFHINGTFETAIYNEGNCVEHHVVDITYTFVMLCNGVHTLALRFYTG